MATIIQSEFDKLVKGYEEQIARFNDQSKELQVQLDDMRNEFEATFGGVRPEGAEAAEAYDIQEKKISQLEIQISQLEEEKAGVEDKKAELLADVEQNLTVVIPDPTDVLFQFGQIVKEEVDTAERNMSDAINDRLQEAISTQEEYYNEYNNILEDKIADLAKERNEAIEAADANMDAKAFETYVNFFDEGNGSYEDLAEKGLNTDVIAKLKEVSSKTEAEWNESVTSELYSRFSQIWTDYGSLYDPWSDQAYELLVSINGVDSDLLDTTNKISEGFNYLSAWQGTAIKSSQKWMDQRGMFEKEEGYTDEEYKALIEEIEANGNLTSTEKLEAKAAATREYQGIGENGVSGPYNDVMRRTGMYGLFVGNDTAKVRQGFDSLRYELADLNNIGGNANVYERQVEFLTADVDVKHAELTAEIAKLSDSKEQYLAEHANAKAKQQEKIEEQTTAVAEAQDEFNASDSIEDSSDNAKDLVDAKAILMRTKLSFSTFMLAHYAELTKFEAELAQLEEEKNEVEEAQKVLEKAATVVTKLKVEIDNAIADAGQTITDRITPIVDAFSAMLDAWVNDTEQYSPVNRDFQNRTSVFPHESSIVPSIHLEIDTMLNDALSKK